MLTQLALCQLKPAKCSYNCIHYYWSQVLLFTTPDPRGKCVVKPFEEVVPNLESYMTNDDHFFFELGYKPDSRYPSHMQCDVIILLYGLMFTCLLCLYLQASH